MSAGSLAACLIGLVPLVLLSPETRAEERATLQIGAFSDITFRATDGEGDHSAFALGQLGLFLTSEVGDQWHVLSETVFEVNEENAAVMDIERLQARYDFHDALSITAGRMHQQLGLYNNAYHHGAILETAIGRPAAVGFEDEGGLLPVHVTGIAVSGRVGDRLALGYSLEIGNGRGRNPDEVLGVSDLNDTKSVNAFALIEVPGIFLRVGGNVLRDRIPSYANDAGVEIHAAVDETKELPILRRASLDVQGSYPILAASDLDDRSAPAAARAAPVIMVGLSWKR